MRLRGGVPGDYVIIERALDRTSGEIVDASANAVDVGLAPLDEDGSARIPLVTGVRYRVCLVGRNVNGARNISVECLFPRGAMYADVDLSFSRTVPQERILRWQGPAIEEARQSGLTDSALVRYDLLRLIEPTISGQSGLTIMLAGGGRMQFSALALWPSKVEVLPSGDAMYGSHTVNASGVALPPGASCSVHRQSVGVPEGHPRSRTIVLQAQQGGSVRVSPVTDSEMAALLEEDLVFVLGLAKTRARLQVRGGDYLYEVSGELCKVAIPAETAFDEGRGPAVRLRRDTSNQDQQEWVPVLAGVAELWIPHGLEVVRGAIGYADGTEIAVRGDVMRDSNAGESAQCLMSKVER